jgi:hypothetical protein
LTPTPTPTPTDYCWPGPGGVNAQLPGWEEECGHLGEYPGLRQTPTPTPISPIPTPTEPDPTPTPEPPTSSANTIQNEDPGDEITEDVPNGQTGCFPKVIL